MKKWLQRLALGLGVAVSVVLVGGAAWLATPAALMPEANAALKSSATVEVKETPEGWMFMPEGQTPAVGFIFYSGGRVPAAAYAPAAQKIAEQGYAVFLPPMPFNLAFFNINAAQAIQQAHPEITAWAVGGHSLGGVAASEYAAQNLGRVQGLVLWASYPNSNVSQAVMRAVSIYGALENSRESFTSAQARANLPARVEFVSISGGNHEQFGYYTGQLNDAVPQVGRDSQQQQVVEATVKLLSALK
ncbi:MAG: alpha/beta hydrolase [Anaerolineales bacterium]|nr:alpha/beta hydrolase [Anaerolineales bacterium]